MKLEVIVAPMPRSRIKFECALHSLPLCGNNYATITYQKRKYYLLDMYSIAAFEKIGISLQYYKANCSVLMLTSKVPSWLDITKARKPTITIPDSHWFNSYYSTLADLVESAEVSAYLDTNEETFNKANT